MAAKPTSWNDVRGKGFFVAVLLASVLTFAGQAIYTTLTAKNPGDTHCYGGICHRVYTLDEARRMIGQTVDLVATHYDWPGADKYNTGEYTSSGEVFDADNPARISASNFPDGAELLLWHPETRRAIHVRVNDFGPFKGNRTLDVTRRAADVMGWASRGVATLKTTVIWVPSPTDAKYRKGRVYPPSLGLVGIVEAHQYGALVDALIATAAARNGQEPGRTTPDTVALLNEPPQHPPSFNAEGPDEAAKVATTTALALDAMQARLPAVLMADAPAIDAIYAEAPRFRPEAIANVAGNMQADARAVAVAIASLPPLPSPAPLPDAASAPAPVVVAVAEQAAAQETERSIQSAKVDRVESGPREGNRSFVAIGSVKPDVTVTTASPVAEGSVVVASARVPLVARSWLAEPPVYLIGIALMLSTLWGAATFARSRRRDAVIAGALPRANEAPVDTLALARRAAETAEGRARVILEGEAARSASDEHELAAREDLARELALRDFEREQEAAMRTRAEAAAAAHASAQRDLAALEASRARRARVVPALDTEVVARPAVATPRAIEAPKPQPPRALANAQEMARFPGIRDAALVGAVLGLPGAVKFWGNTIIKQMRLEGSARSGSPLRIDGVVDGACLAPVLLISEGASVSGVIAAETVIVLGKVTGVVSGRNVVVAATAEVDGEVFYQSISIDPQAHCDITFSRLALEQDPLDVGSTVYGARAAA